jgi:hypothetical protein
MLGIAAGHRGTDAELARLVAGGADDDALRRRRADDYRLADQCRVVALLDGGRIASGRGGWKHGVQSTAASGCFTSRHFLLECRQRFLLIIGASIIAIPLKDESGIPVSLPLGNQSDVHLLLQQIDDQRPAQGADVNRVDRQIFAGRLQRLARLISRTAGSPLGKAA